MQTLAFDGRMGASGDMILGALIDAGANQDVLKRVEDALGVEYVTDRRTDSGIEGLAVDVQYEQAHKHSQDHAHPVEGHGPTRTHGEVIDIVEAMALTEDVRERALRIFDCLAEAESSVHGSETAAFHEVGADDAIADVVGASLLLADIDVDRIVTTPLSVGGGRKQMAHGTYPIPAPAVRDIAASAEWTITGGPIERELLTPTGAAVLAEVADGVETLPTMEVTATGYGSGDHDIPEYPNVLGVLHGETAGRLKREEISVLETNVDDVSPEMLGSLQETLINAGARDVTVVPATMKKSRPGHLIKVVVPPEDAERVARKLAKETGTLGVREHGAGHRWVADRETRSVSIDIAGDSYAIDVKIATDREGLALDASAEYEDAIAIARETSHSVREIMDRAEHAFEQY